MKANAERAIRILMEPAKLFGLFPISRDCRRTYRVSALLLALSSLKCLTYTLVTIIFFSLDMNQPENITLSVEMDYPSMILIAAVPILSMCELLCTIDDFNETLFFLEAIEAQLMQLGKCVDYNTSKTSLVVNSLFALGALVSRMVKNVISESVGPLLTSAQLFVHISLLGHMVVLVYWYFGAVGVATKQFSACNQELLLYSEGFVFMKERKVEKLVRAHHTLCLCSNLLNEIHGLQLIAIFLTCFVISVSETYRGVVLLNEELTAASCLALGTKLCWVAVCFSLCFQIVTACKRCATEAKNFNTLLYQLMLNDKSNDISNNEKLHLHVTMRREVVFTACGFFRLDYTLVHSMIAAATTYLVILIQFAQAASTSSSVVLNSSTVFVNTTDFPSTTGGIP